MKTFYLAIVASTVQYPNLRTVIKLSIKEGIHEKLLFLRDMYGVALARALNLLFASINFSSSDKLVERSIASIESMKVIHAVGSPENQLQSSLFDFYFRKFTVS